MPFRPFSSSSGDSFARIRRGVLPNLCALCGNLSQATLCAGCAEAYWNESRLRCTVCAVPLSAARRARHAHYRCADCIGEPPPFDATFALADYRAPLDTLAVGLKFRARLMLAREFALRLARLAQDARQDRSEWPEVIAPVPLASRRLTERGYNQAWQIAKPLARALQVRSDATLLHRVIHTVPQSRLDLDARRQNVGRAFKVAQPVQGLHVGIVDDVMTTGATLEALARTLKAAGARRVTNFVALRTPKN
ncbi:competence protein ComF [Paraburkholderia ginsengiterrae]|uniref:Competence protein ComF n=1 Tax=Paraburkholderia ginsengiterrae TaxID=1462993 RepID=A0A1A9NEK1_9BURK|nr:ComF family protein [Paraburkholderia ginsengiterrae]OAJ60299.1 competence protein ComF [Paraburkholderia ginsengiterrae]OAJ64840.1 competence protein ComF [Paraburkholderia ginsengiterrae]